MIPVYPREKHDPENGSWGDCFRCAIASILELDAEQVPHFFDKGVNGEIGLQAARDFLADRKKFLFWIAFDGNLTTQSVLDDFSTLNPSGYYMLIGSTETGNQHVVVCSGNAIVHNPSWWPQSLVGPAANGHWIVAVITV